MCKYTGDSDDAKDEDVVPAMGIKLDLNLLSGGLKVFYSKPHQSSFKW
jgi:hypothetical protein